MANLTQMEAQETTALTIYDPPECPDLKICDYPTTQDFFARICRTKNFKNCNQYCRKRKLLKRPMDWITSIVSASIKR